MTYARLFYLKFKKGLSTYELACRYPMEIHRVTEIALLDVPEETLKKVVKEEKAFDRLMKLKKRFSDFF